jgi:hypothetical protein
MVLAVLLLRGFFAEGGRSSASSEIVGGELDPAEDAAAAAGTGERGASEEEDGIMNNKFGNGDGWKAKAGRGAAPSLENPRGVVCRGAEQFCGAVLLSTKSSVVISG